MLIRKLDPLGRERTRYEAELIEAVGERRTVRAIWQVPGMALEYLSIETGDIVIEDFFEDRGYNVMAFHGADGALKGWYANVTRPARFHDAGIDWEDLILDAFMSPDGELRILDEDEFAEHRASLAPDEAVQALRSLDLAVTDLRERWRALANDAIAAALTARGWTIGTAESCTGGHIGDLLTDRSGSSAYFLGGIIAYANAVKQARLGVRAETLERHGAVSAETALEMARGARAALGVDVAISATGIAGPGGGTPEKPVGLVYLGLATPTAERVERHVWTGERVANKHASADAALGLLLRALRGNA